MEALKTGVLVSDAQRIAFKRSASELAAINFPSLVASGISEAKQHSALPASITIMEASDIVFSLGAFLTERLDRRNRHKEALRIRQGFALGHVATAGAGVMFGINDIVQGNEPSAGNLWVSSAVVGASVLSLCFDRVRAKHSAHKDADDISQNQNHQEIFHGLNSEFVQDMKKTNIAEIGGVALALVSQKSIGMENGAALFTIAGSLGVIGIMGRNFLRQQRIFKKLFNHIVTK